MNVWFYEKDSDSNVCVNDVEFYNFYKNKGILAVKRFDGNIETFDNIDYISNVYDSNYDCSHHEII